MAIRPPLAAEQIIFLTHDTEFDDHPLDHPAIVIISRVPQGLPTRIRVKIRFDALRKFLSDRPTGKLFDLLESGEIVAWKAPESSH